MMENDISIEKNDKNNHQHLVNIIWEHGHLLAKIIQGKEKAGVKFTPYFDYVKPACLVGPAHALDLIRGRKAGYLRLSFKLPEEVVSLFPDDVNLLSTLKKSEKAVVDKKLFSRLRERAGEEATALCVQHLRECLMARPAGQKVIMGLDTRLRGGIKIAIIDATGKLLDSTNLHLYPPLKDWYGSLAELAKLIIKHKVEWIGIGAGPALRESARLIHDFMKMYPDLTLSKKILSIAAPPYSPSELIDESLWTAVSIGRQLQDPLNELIKIDPLRLNLGPYREDAHPEKLKIALNDVINDCINKVRNSAQDPRIFTKKNVNPPRRSFENKHTKTPSQTKENFVSRTVFNTAMADAFAKLKRGDKS